jgi:hypothetical protein
VLHFCAALLISAILSVPWGGLVSPAIALALCGAAGTAYSISTLRHARRQGHYQPDTEDWFWYVSLPLAAYGATLIAGIVLRWQAKGSLYALAAIALLLLFIGIHNAWDTVTYIALQRDEPNAGQE